LCPYFTITFALCFINLLRIRLISCFVPTPFASGTMRCASADYPLREL
jgi:hypothetical protein